ncbi:glutamyl-tRNA reductase [Candidatus Methanodesulfokora washburnensis]|jgi:glutamyl-tRNA reductase|uniref:Glutamyl-tRNA reductase n=1 Tax=Candidatus Methanodesulfokora washburnensis TaxID=2478471 RepID=A0A3R9PE49_9CREN|nr:glutamyl-tRNA reductase [Candidatus Methanodesulfokores washburnensis]RSN73919.1 glutamyl-tRNA reductase [Candidatus Methanodesulfokores washburnensis]
MGYIAVAMMNYKMFPLYRIEKAFLKNKETALRRISSINGITGTVLIQTCNRVEIFLETEIRDLSDVIKAWEELSGDRKLSQDVEIAWEEEAIRHLFRLAAGLESMAIGENEILHQIKEAYILSSKLSLLSRDLRSIFDEALKVGKRVRSSTSLGKKRISIAEMAVEVAERILGGLQDRVIMVIGAGETGSAVIENINMRNKRNLRIMIANRTYDRAVQLANSFGGIALKLDDVDRFLPVVDVVFVTTSAPHYIITKERASKLEGRSTLIFDLSMPRNVDPEASRIKGIKVITIDDLREYLDEEASKKLEDIKRAEDFVEKSLENFLEKRRRSWAEEIISNFCRMVEEARKEELMEAIRILGCDEETAKVMDRMSKAMIKRIVGCLVDNLRRNLSSIDRATIELILSDYTKKEKSRRLG